MQQSNLDALYSQINALPSLPSIVNDVMRVTADPESSATDLMTVILPDPSMCTAILKIANSAFFGLPREVTTIEKAVMVLGFDEVKNIVLGKAVFNSFKELNGKNKKDIEELWHHSFSCGLAAKILAERSGQSPSEMFIAGLIHDIGKLAMLITFPTLYSHMLKRPCNDWNSYIEKEKELFLLGHDEVAYRILNKWLFPRQLLTAVGFHHHPKEVEQDQLLPATIEIADLLAHVSSTNEPVSLENMSNQMLHLEPNLFTIWQKNDLPCDQQELCTWIELLQRSKEKDIGILSAFSS